MLNRYFSLRLLIPAIIALLLLVSTIFSFFVSRHYVFNEVLVRVTERMADRFQVIQGVMRHFIEYDEIDSIKRLGNSLSNEEDVVSLIVVSKEGKVVYSNDRTELGLNWDVLTNKLDKKKIYHSLQRLEEVSDHDAGSQTLTSYRDLCYQKSLQQLRTDDCGFIYYQINLKYHYDQANRSLYQGFLAVGSVLFLGIILLVLIMKYMITRRIGMLVDSLELYAKGDLRVRTNLPGNDELSWLSASVNKLLETIEDNQGKILEREQRLEKLFQTVMDAIFVINDKGKIVRVNQAAIEMFGYHEDEIVGQNIKIIMPEPFKSEHDKYLENYKRTGIKHVIGVKTEVVGVKRDASQFPAEISITEMLLPGRTMFAGIIRDITERKEFEEAMQHVNEELRETNLKLNEYATKDGLTNIYNRRSFDQRMIEELNRATREKMPLTLLMCDIDYFKAYNDTYGHQAGDDCLYKVATLINTFFQRGGEMVARYGGEEFAVILPGTDTERAQWLAEMVVRAIHELAIPHSSSKVSDTVTISIGIGSYTPKGNISPSPTQLLRAADEGLYKAKANGRDRIETGSAVG